MMSLRKGWLREAGACGRDYEVVEREWGDKIPVTWEAFEHAKKLGLNLMWLGVRLMDGAGRRAFVALTIDQRREALEQRQGKPLPKKASELEKMATEAWEAATEATLIECRNLSAALRELARDVALTEPTPLDCERAARATLRAVSWLGGDEGGIQRQQQQWRAERVLGPKGKTGG